MRVKEDEDYELYGMFYQFKNKIQDDRPSDYGKRKPHDGKAFAVLDLQENIQSLLSTETESTLAVETEQSFDNLDNVLAANVSELNLSWSAARLTLDR